jgi:outer membrane protein with beta-barrel domain
VRLSTIRSRRMRFRKSRPSGSRSMQRLLVMGLAGGLTAFAGAGEAQALPLISLSASARGLYGSAVGDQDPSPYGVGLGLRAGVTLPMSLYLGGSFDYFFGESVTLDDVESSASLLQLMANVGYDLGLGPLTLRPSLGLGFAERNADGNGEDGSDFVASPGVEALVGLGLLSVSAEARYNKIFEDDADAFILGLGVGFSL